MIAKDVSLARAMVQGLDAIDFSNNATVQYAHDVETKIEEVNSVEISVDATLSHQNLAREKWATSVTAEVVATGRQTATGLPGDAAAEAEKGSWLAFIDEELIAWIQTNRVDGHKAASITFEQRLDTEKLRTMSLFYTKFQINYPLV